MNKLTLFYDEIDDVLLKNVKKENRPIIKNKHLGNVFYVLSSDPNPVYHVCYFEIQDNLISCRKDENSEEIAYMDINNSFMKLTNNTMIKNVPHYGIKFIKKRAYEELLTPSEEVVSEWFEYLKRFCILTKFRLYFETIKVIGKGNFAKVFLVERKNDQKQYAVKVFQKSLIMADELEKKCLLYEIKMMKQMDHYRVLKLHELYEGENFIYCLCEYPLFADDITEERIRQSYDYAFDKKGPNNHPGATPQFELRRVDETPFDLLGVTLTPIRLWHGQLPVLGYRIGKVAFCTDVSRIPDESWPLLEGLDVLILDALREKPHPTHFSVNQALEVVSRVRPRQAFFTHISHALDYEATNRMLPSGVELAYDGLRIPLT